MLDLPGFFSPLIPVKMAPRQRGDHEEESIHRRADGGHPAGGRPYLGCRGGAHNKVSAQTIYGWRKRFGELAPVDVKHLRALEAENSRLKRLLAERDLDISVSRRSNAKSGEPAGAARAGRVRLLKDRFLGDRSLVVPSIRFAARDPRS